MIATTKAAPPSSNTTIMMIAPPLIRFVSATGANPLDWPPSSYRGRLFPVFFDAPSATVLSALFSGIRGPIRTRNRRGTPRSTSALNIGSMGSTHTEASLTRAWFADEAPDGAAELFVETPDRVGCLFAVVTAIIGARVKIVKSEATIADGLARDWFLLVEADGRSLAASRREQVRSRVLAAIATWWQRGAA
jgi:hypothetical protein